MLGLIFIRVRMFCMKRRFRSICSCLIAISTLFSCNSKTDSHKHTFSCVVNQNYLCKDATVDSPATYFKSCECGAKSEETFEFGQTLKYGFTNSPLEGSYTAFFSEYDDTDLVKIAENLLCPIVINKIIGDYSTVKYKHYSFNYESTYLDSSRIVLSGAITIPYVNDVPYVKFVDVDSHPTLTQAYQAPSLNFDIFGFLGLAGGLVIELDLLGFGHTNESPVDYHCRHLAAKNTVDGVIAALNLIKDELSISLEGKKIFNTGYSQGGYDALALMRYLETEATDYEKSMINFDYNFCGSGAYDLAIMFENSLRNKSYETPEYVLMGIISAYNFHPEIFEDFVVEDFLTDYGKQFIQPIIDKNQDEIDILKNQIGKDGSRIYQGPDDFFNFNYENPDPKKIEILNKINELESLIKGDWLPAGRLTLFYLPNDNVVSPKSSLKAKEVFAGLENVKFVEGFLNDHGTGAVLFYCYCIIKILSEI